MVDLSKIKKEFIPASEVPPPHTRTTEWDGLFSSIPRGQALVLREPEVNGGTVRGALQRKHNLGKFKNLEYSSKGVHGSATVYITNTEKPIEGISRKAKPVTQEVT